MSLHIIYGSLFALYTTAHTQGNNSGTCNVSWVNQKFRVGCCVDFKLINGVCKPCIGQHGVNCTLPCKFGYFGFGCRQTCNCTDRQGCDRHTGCFDYKEKNNEKSFYGVAIFVTMVLSSLFWGGVIVVNKRYGPKIRALLNQGQRNHDVGIGDIRKENYDDIRESRMVLKTSDGLNPSGPLNRMTAGSCPRGSDNYHHLTSTKYIPKRIHSNAYNANLRQTEHQSCNKLSDDDVSDGYLILVK